MSADVPSEAAGATAPPGPVAPLRAAPRWAAPLFTVAAVAAMVVLRLVLLPRQVTPIGYGVPLVAYLWLRDRRWLWLAALGFAAVSFGEMFVTLPSNPLPELHSLRVRLTDFGLVLLDLLAVAGAVHAVIGGRAALERRHRDLWAANGELAAREEEIARQNEELQSQTEELERQSEELRVGNEELAERERTLEALLNLSRALARDTGRAQTMEQICQTMGQLLNGPAARGVPGNPDAAGGMMSATAIMEHEGDSFVVRCHRGFGDAGPAVQSVPVEKSFASIVLSEGRTAYLQDLSLRPDLSVPQPREGPPFVAVLAAPLRVGGWPVGTLEAYSREKTAWSPGHMALLESLAAQASVSLEAASLFDRVANKRRRMEAVLRATPIGIAIAEDHCGDVRLNPAGAALFGIPPDTNVAPPGAAPGPGAPGPGAPGPGPTGPWQLFSAAGPLPPEQYPLLRAARGEEVRGLEVDALLPTGRRLSLLVHASPIRDAAGGTSGAVSAFADVTAMKESRRELDARRREAEEASVRKTRFLAAVSHDIRTPANAISLLSELIRRTASNPAMAGEVPELARELHGSAVSLVNLLSDVLDVARFDSDRIELQESEFPLDALLVEEHRRMHPLARDKGLELAFPAGADGLSLRTDRIKLSRVLGNLIGNAIKFTDRGRVSVEVARPAGGGVEFHVTDTGVGIPPEHQQSIFDEFIQLRNPERDRNKGTGLGLTICKRLVDAMGGRLAVRSEPGRGSTFVVALPTGVVV